jgi:phosphoribosylformylglycinamidine cyclo-ligase
VTGTADGLTYAASGVDVEAGDRAVTLMKGWVAKTQGPEILGGLGGFAGLYDAHRLAAYAHPVLATSTDGVGTKVAIAQQMGVHDTIGFDLVGMVVDDIVVCGAEPLFMTDYIACGRVVPERIAAIVKGIAEACLVAGCALVGGETAEHPGLLELDEYDVAGAATGVVERDRILGPHLVQDGDILVAMASSGLHSNGYSLVRAVLASAGWELDREVPELGRTLGAELLEPTRVYAADVLDLVGADLDVHALSHVTGGGLAANLARVLPPGLLARVDRATWTPAPIFGLVGGLGSVPREDLERTLNMGVGMVAVVPAESADQVVRRLADRDLLAWIAGTVTPEDGRSAAGHSRGAKGVDGGAAVLEGAHP